MVRAPKHAPTGYTANIPYNSAKQPSTAATHLLRVGLAVLHPNLVGPVVRPPDGGLDHVLGEARRRAHRHPAHAACRKTRQSAKSAKAGSVVKNMHLKG